MFNESIQAHPLLDKYKALKEHKKTADKEHRELLHSMLDHYGMFHRIKQRIGESDIKGSLWWPCVQLEEFMWHSIRRFLQDYGYDPRWLIWRDGKAGLQGFNYNDGIPCEFDEILITYDGMERMEHPIPVRKDGKCGLVLPDGAGTQITPFKYDMLFREPYTDYVKYIAVVDGKYGIVNTEGKEVVPCILDDIFERQDTDGFIPVMKDGKWGIITDNETFIMPKFDELEIRSEDYLRARIGNRWGWVTEKGNLSNSRRYAAFGSWAEEGK